MVYLEKGGIFGKSTGFRERYNVVRVFFQIQLGT
jgi:hypothetical protein